MRGEGRRRRRSNRVRVWFPKKWGGGKRDESVEKKTDSWGLSPFLFLTYNPVAASGRKRTFQGIETFVANSQVFVSIETFLVFFHKILVSQSGEKRGWERMQRKVGEKIRECVWEWQQVLVARSNSSCIGPNVCIFAVSLKRNSPGYPECNRSDEVIAAIPIHGVRVRLVQCHGNPLLLVGHFDYDDGNGPRHPTPKKVTHTRKRSRVGGRPGLLVKTKWFQRWKRSSWRDPLLTDPRPTGSWWWCTRCVMSRCPSRWENCSRHSTCPAQIGNGCKWDGRWEGKKEVGLVSNGMLRELRWREMGERNKERTS